MSVVRVLIAVLVLFTAAPLGALTGHMSPVVQFAAVMSVMFAVSFVLPHYFYDGEPLLPDRKPRRRRPDSQHGPNGATG
jgi:hypothetical protein